MRSWGVGLKVVVSEDPSDGSVAVSVDDTDHPDVHAWFMYKWAGEDPVLRQAGVLGKTGGVPDFRTLPNKRWERAARAKLLMDQSDALPTSVDEHDIYERTAREYREGLAQGLVDPVAGIARTHGVKPGTARAWVHRARKKGLLGPAAGTLPSELPFTRGEG